MINVRSQKSLNIPLCDCTVVHCTKKDRRKLFRFRSKYCYRYYRYFEEIPVYRYHNLYEYRFRKLEPTIPVFLSVLQNTSRVFKQRKA